MTGNTNFRKILVAALAVTLGAVLPPTTARGETASVAPLAVPVVIGDGPGVLIPLVLQAADLDDEQRTEAVQLVEAEGAAIRERLKQIARLDVELSRLMFATNRQPTQAQLSPIIKRMVTLRQEIVDREVAILMRVRGSLKPEQRAAVTAMDDQFLKVVSQPGSDGPSGRYAVSVLSRSTPNTLIADSKVFAESWS